MRGKRALLLGSCAVSFLVLGTALAEKGVKPVLPSGCDLDEVAKWSESGWVCAPDIGSLDPSISCPAGWIPRSTGASWECVEDPTGRVANMEDYLARSDNPITVTVDCTKGESVNQALSEKVGWRVAPATIELKGFCDEDIGLSQSNITFRPAEGAPLGTGVGSLSLFGARNIRVENLRVAREVSAQSSTLSAENLLVDAPTQWNLLVGSSSYANVVNSKFTNCQVHSCIGVQAGSTLQLNGGTVVGQGAHIAATVDSGGSLIIYETTIRDFGRGIEIASGGSATLYNAVIEESTENAVFSFGTLDLIETIVRNNLQEGIVTQPGGRVSIIRGEIVGNGAGLAARGSSVYVQEAEISGNHGPGIVARNGSHLMVVGSLITANEGDGIRLGDVSTMMTLGHTDLTANLRWGLYCAPSPAVAQYTLPSGSEVHAQDNFEGQIYCPLSTE